MNQPRLRFKEFKGEWEETKLSNECTRINDGTHGNSEYKENGAVAFIICNNIKNGKININKNTPYVNESQKEKDDYSLDKSTILISTVGTIGNTACYNNENIKIGRSVAYINSDLRKLDRNFLRMFIEHSKNNNYFLKRLTGTSVKALTLNTIRNIKIKKSSLLEQQKIGQFFQNLYQQIELQSDKLEHLKQAKQGYLQKMFAHNNKKQPNLRFHNYYDKWKTLMIRDIAKVIGGGTPSTSNPSYWNGNINWYSPNEITEKPFSYESIKKITELGLRNSSAKLHPINTILFTSRAGIGKMTIIKNPSSTNQGFQSLELKNDIYPYFIYSMNRIIKHKAILLSSGSTFLEISKKNMEKIKLCIPSLPEQQRIGQFFSHLDRIIDLQQQKIDRLKRQKQAYLQKMFI